MSELFILKKEKKADSRRIINRKKGYERTARLGCKLVKKVSKKNTNPHR